MFYQTWFLVYWDYSIQDENVYCHVFSERMASEIVKNNSKVSIGNVGGMNKDDILKKVYHSEEVIDDLVYQHPRIFAKEKFKIWGYDGGVSDYYPISKYRSDQLDLIGI